MKSEREEQLMYMDCDMVCVCVCVFVCVCVCVIVKRPVLLPCAVDCRSRNPLYYYYIKRIRYNGRREGFSID